jgi:hypothetical protein
MSRYLVSSNVCALLACSVLLISSIGCSPGTPTAPSLAPQNVVESPNFIRILSASDTKDVQGPSLAQGPVATMISADIGGTITSGRFTLVFSPNALDEDTEITIEVINDGTLGVELGPHGIQFNQPVVLEMDLTGTTAEGEGDAASTLWFNEDQGWWEAMPHLNGNEDRLKTTLEHFSKYKAGTI